MSPEVLARRSDTPQQRLVLATLTECGAMLQCELAQHLGLHRNTVQKVVERLHKNGLVFVSAWVRPKRTNALSRAWAIRTSEYQRDAVKPPRKPRRAVVRDYYVRHQARILARRALERGDPTNPWKGLMT